MFLVSVLDYVLKMGLVFLKVDFKHETIICQLDTRVLFLTTYLSLTHITPQGKVPENNNLPNQILLGY